jgi:hypothetical protein
LNGQIQFQTAHFKKLPRYSVMDASEPARHPKRPFTLEEDKILLSFVSVVGPRNWGQLAAQLHNRTPKQCRERWNNQLNPHINKTPWSADEDRILAEKQATLGNQWVQIARFLPGRTDTQVKNRWNSCVKAKARELQEPVGGGLLSWLEAMSEGKTIRVALADMDSLPPLHGAKH